MKYTQYVLSLVLVHMVITPAIWLRKDPEAIIAGEHHFFFPFLKEEHAALVRMHRPWSDEVLAYFANKIKQYPTSAYAQNQDRQLVVQAQDILKKEYQNFITLLTNPARMTAEHSKHHCRGLSAQRNNVQTLLQQTAEELFGNPLIKQIGMVGIQGPNLEDFQRRAHIEDRYATYMQELQNYKTCLESKHDTKLIKKAYAHLHKAYNFVLDTQGLRTEKMMEQV